MALKLLQRKVEDGQKGECQKIKAKWNIIFIEPGCFSNDGKSFSVTLKNGLLSFPVSKIPKEAIAFTWQVVIEVIVKIFGQEFVIKEAFNSVRIFLKDRVKIRTFKEEKRLNDMGQDNSGIVYQMSREKRRRIVRSKFDPEEAIDHLICSRDSLLLDLKNGKFTEIEKSK